MVNVDTWTTLWRHYDELGKWWQCVTVVGDSRCDSSTSVACHHRVSSSVALWISGVFNSLFLYLYDRYTMVFRYSNLLRHRCIPMSSVVPWADLQLCLFLDPSGSLPLVPFIPAFDSYCNVRLRHDQLITSF